MPDNAYPSRGLSSDTSLVRLPSLMMALALLACGCGVFEYLYAERVLGIIVLATCLIWMINDLIETPWLQGRSLRLQLSEADLAKLLSQILVNLISNAFKFTSHGYVNIAVKCEQSSNAIEFIVRDTGIGIAADFQEKIFERFSRENTTDSGGNQLLKELATD